jgi:uncharacterized protein (TIGR03435 family)
MYKLYTVTLRNKLLLSAAALGTLAIPLVYGTARATPVQAHSQPATLNLSDFRFDVASIKPAKDPSGGWGLNATPDGIHGQNVPLLNLVEEAYGIYEDNRYSGAPNWINSENYDVEAKMDSSTADAFRKLPKVQRALAEQQMLQVLLVERFNLQIHRDTKEFPVYFLVVAKGGPKLQEAKPNPDDPKAPTNAVWGNGRIVAGVRTLTAKLMPIEQLASVLTNIAGRKVLDKTEIAGTYDFTLQYASEQNVVTPLEGQPAPALDPNGVSIFTALQQQLGLKLESGKAPIEIIVIDHIEHASGN